MSENDGENLCGYIKDNDEPCRLPAGWGTDHVGEGRCDHHPGRGAPPGNSNAVGNDGGDGAPDGHFRTLRTGDNVAADRWIEFINEEADDELCDMFVGWVEHFREQGAGEAASVRLAILWTKADYNNMELIKEDFTRPLYHEGMRVGEVFDSDRDSSAIQNEREARLYRREDELSPHSQSDSSVTVEGSGDVSVSIDISTIEDAEEIE